MKLNGAFLEEIDFYGKMPEFYFNGNPKKVSFIGLIFTIIFIIIYIAIFIYKLYRMFQRIDITFYDSYSDRGEIPSINVTNENFYIAFSIYDGSIGEPFIDETIYYPVAYFKDNETEQNLEIRPCSIDKIGSKYKKFFVDSPLDKYYCFNKINHTLKAYMNSFAFKIYPCKNTSENNNHCKSKEIIDFYLNGNNFVIILEDIIITPLKFERPVKERTNELYTTLYKTFGQYLYIEMQLVSIETNKNIIGFDFLTNEKIENFIKYDTLEIIPQPGYDLNDKSNNYPVCEVEFQLKDKILSEKRGYTQLIDVLGEVGGFMEFINSFLWAICSFIVDILYEKSIVNNLFSFNLKKKIVIIKNKGKDFNIKVNCERKINDNNDRSNRILSANYNYNKDNRKVIEDFTNRGVNDKNSEDIIIDKKKLVMVNIMETNTNNIDNEIIKYEKHLNKDMSKPYNIDYMGKEKNSNLEKKYIKLNNCLLYLGFCFIRDRKNVDNVLLNEGLSIIKKKLDIFNILKNLLLSESIQKNIKCEFEEIKFSEECSKTLDKLIVK